MDAVSELCMWYERQSVNDWQEDSGITISSLDNPGWSLKVDLKGTDLQHKDFREMRIDKSEHDWLFARRTEYMFEAFGGPGNLNALIATFVDWTQQS